LHKDKAMTTTDQGVGAMAPMHDQAGEGAALLIVDVINDFDFEGAERLLPHAKAAAERILALRELADAQGVPVVYVNDNFGQWHSEKSALVEHVGERLMHPDIAPRQDDYFVIKPQLSGFYATNLQVLLPKLAVKRLVITGLVTDICVLFTAADASMRDYRLWVPSDATAAERGHRHEAALELMRSHLGAETRSTQKLSLRDWTASLDDE